MAIAIAIVLGLFALPPSFRHTAWIGVHAFELALFVWLGVYYGRHDARVAVGSGLGGFGALWSLIRELLFPKPYPHFPTPGEYVGGVVALLGLIVLAGASRQQQGRSDVGESN